MPEKKESPLHLKSEYAGSFRSGLRLPVLDAKANNLLLDDGDGDTLEGDADNSSHEIRTASATKSRSRHRESGREKGLGLGKVRRRSQGKSTLDENEEDSLNYSVDTDEDSVLKGVRSLVLASAGDSESGTRISLLSARASSQSLGTLSKATKSQSKTTRTGTGTRASSASTTKAPNKVDHLETELNQRISTMYQSIESLEKKRVNFNNSVRAATRRTATDGVKKKTKIKTFLNHNNSKVPASATNSSSTTLEIGDQAAQDHQEEGSNPKTTSTEQQQQHMKKSSRIIDVTRTYPKMFGLDPMKVIASSEDDSEVDENGVRDPRKKTKKSIRKYLEQFVKEEQPRDMSAIMPTLSEKTFLTKLQKRETQLNKEINDMKSNLDVMNMKAEREAKKAKAERNRNKTTNNKLNVTRLMVADSDRGPARELTDFLQATGGSCGGWETEDHHIFLRSFTKWSARPTKLVENLCQLLPGKRPEEIVEHTAWYEKYEKLNTANRTHIRQWQINKRKERELVYQMSSQSQKARIETDKRYQDTIQLKRAEERQKNKDLLNEWKRSKGRARRPFVSASAAGIVGIKALDDEVEALDTSQKLSKMDKELTGIRREVKEITSMTKDIGKSLRTVNQTEIDKTVRAATTKGRMGKQMRERTGTAGSEDSSGFCEMTMDEITTVGDELAGDGEKFLRSHEHMMARQASANANPPIFYTKLQRDPCQMAETKKMFKEFRHRDEEMMQAKKKAILGKKEKMRNRAYLTDQEVKERMKNITVPSKVMNPTKQWEIRKEIREQEKLESKNREFGINPWASEDSKNSYSPSGNVNNIPKLGMPSWRRNMS